MIGNILKSVGRAASKSCERSVAAKFLDAIIISAAPLTLTSSVKLVKKIWNSGSCKCVHCGETLPGSVAPGSVLVCRKCGRRTTIS